MNGGYQKIPETPHEFASHWSIEPCPVSGCWLWAGATNGRYPVLTVKKKVFYAHRFSWTLSNGGIPAGMCVCHRCNMPLCVNPDHLFVGSIKENQQHMAACRRGTDGVKSWNAKLTDDDVTEIKKLVEQGWTQQIVGDAFGIRQASVSDICLGRRWKYHTIDEPA